MLGFVSIENETSKEAAFEDLRQNGTETEKTEFRNNLESALDELEVINRKKLAELDAQYAVLEAQYKVSVAAYEKSMIKTLNGVTKTSSSSAHEKHKKSGCTLQ